MSSVEIFEEARSPGLVGLAHDDDEEEIIVVLIFEYAVYKSCHNRFLLIETVCR